MGAGKELEPGWMSQKALAVIAAVVNRNQARFSHFPFLSKNMVCDRFRPAISRRARAR